MKGTMTKDQLMAKVNKLLALAGNNPSQEEANAAFLKAQKLIAQYNLNMDEFSEEKEQIVLLAATHKHINGARIHLAAALAKNFRCRVMMVGRTVHFMGYKTDAEVCVKVFNYAYEVADRQGMRVQREHKKQGLPVQGVYNSYMLGFCKGIKEVLDEQCRALMIVVPEEVDEEVKRQSTGTYKGGTRLNGWDSSAYESGKAAGRDHMRSRQIEAH